MRFNPGLLSIILLAVFLTSPVSGQETLEQAWEQAISVSRKLEAEGYKINSAQATREAASAARMPQFVRASRHGDRPSQQDRL